MGMGRRGSILEGEISNIFQLFKNIYVPDILSILFTSGLKRWGRIKYPSAPCTLHLLLPLYDKGGFRIVRS